MSATTTVTGTGTTITTTVSGPTSGTRILAADVNAALLVLLSTDLALAKGMQNWTTITGDTTLSAATNYRVRVAAGSAALLTLSSTTANDQVRVRHEGPGSAYIVTTAKINGWAQKDAVIVPGADFVAVYIDATTGWAVPPSAVKILPSASLVYAYNSDRLLASSGGNVTAWNDLSANALNLAPGTAPAESTDINGHRSVTFDDAASEFLTVADNAALDISEYTWVALVKPDAQPSVGVIWSHSDDSTNGQIMYQEGNRFTMFEAGYYGQSDVGAISKDGTYLLSAFRTNETSAAAGNGVRRMLVNKLLVKIQGSSVFPQVASSTAVFVGKKPAGSYFSGAMGGIVMHSSASDTLRQMTEDYLAAAFGLSF